MAIPSNSEFFDTTGEVAYSKEKILKSPEKYIELMKFELKRGNLKMVGVLGRNLTELKPYNAEVKAIYSIYYASMTDIKNAEIQLKEAEDISEKNKYTLCAAAMILQAKKLYKEAADACLNAVAMNKEFSYAWNVLGTIYFDMNQYQKAAESFKKAVEIFPGFSLGYLNSGYAYLNAGDNEKAIEYFSKALKLKQDSYNARNGLAIAYEKAGKYSLALEEVQTIQKNMPSYLPDGFRRIGNLQLAAGMYDDAIMTGSKMKKKGLDGAYMILAKSYLLKQDTKQALFYIKKIDEKSASAYFLKGLYMIDEGRFDEALKFMEDALAEDNLFYEAFISKAALKFYLGLEIDVENELVNRWDNRRETILDFISGSIYAKRGDWKQAEEKWQPAIGLDQKTLSSGLLTDELRYDTLGRILYLLGLHENALAEFEIARSMNENSIFANYFSALVYLKDGDTVEAEKYLIRSTEKAPDFFPALSGIGDLHFMKGKNSKAAIYYERALAVKKDPVLLFKLGIIYERQKKYKKTADLAEKLIQQFPDSYLGYNQLAWIYAVQEIRLDKALSYAKKANELKSSHPEILDTLGWVYYKKKQYDKASEYLKKALETEPSNPEINYHLGASYYAEGKNHLAKKYLSIALNHSKTFDKADDARNILYKIEKMP